MVKKRKLARPRIVMPRGRLSNLRRPKRVLKRKIRSKDLEPSDQLVVGKTTGLGARWTLAVSRRAIAKAATKRKAKKKKSRKK